MQERDSRFITHKSSYLLSLCEAQQINGKLQEAESTINSSIEFVNSNNNEAKVLHKFLLAKGKVEQRLEKYKESLDTLQNCLDQISALGQDSPLDAAEAFL